MPVDVKSADYVLGNDKLPALSVSASKDKAGKMHISLVNIDATKTNDVSLSRKGTTVGAVSGRILTSARLQDYNTFTKTASVVPVAFSGFKQAGDNLTVTMPPFSVVVLELN